MDHRVNSMFPLFHWVCVRVCLCVCVCRGAERSKVNLFFSEYFIVVTPIGLTTNMENGDD